VSWLVGDRVWVNVETPFTRPGPGTIVGIDRAAIRPFRVTLDNEDEPFDVMDVRNGDIEHIDGAA
jgi:hypothetical protein